MNKKFKIFSSKINIAIIALTFVAIVLFIIGNYVETVDVFALLFFVADCFLLGAKFYIMYRNPKKNYIEKFFSSGDEYAEVEKKLEKRERTTNLFYSLMFFILAISILIFVLKSVF